jgi:tRNA nucleotidyltransferase (CCA-adding enzyme)
VLRDAAIIKGATIELTEPGVAPSTIYDLLHGRSLTALAANSLATGSPATAEHIELYLNVLRHVKPALTGDDLKKLGIPEGPKIKEVLQLLREARLDGKVSNKEEEEAIVRSLGTGSRG